jgi:hypothetical protein
MSVVVPAVASMLAALVLAALAGLLFQPKDRRAFGSHQLSGLGMAILAVLASILCVLSAFLWFRYLVVDPVRHLGEPLD